MLYVACKLLDVMTWIAKKLSASNTNNTSTGEFEVVYTLQVRIGYDGWIVLVWGRLEILKPVTLIVSS